MFLLSLLLRVRPVLVVMLRDASAQIIVIIRGASNRVQWPGCCKQTHGHHLVPVPLNISNTAFSTDVVVGFFFLTVLFVLSIKAQIVYNFN